uniref:Uncharacterized protein n=1 Tax=Branchiostoma floridae TaxID=7739 RepID=C3YWZ4_BRAFL|eukprot:XP_002599376.1 hypothetical protein BRAFLDRAFT_64266 [Branchiostoma floridae]
MAAINPTIKVTPPTPEQQEQTLGYLTFEGALQRALQNGQLQPNGQQHLINDLIHNTPAKSEYNRLCKAQLGIQYANEKLGNNHRLQSVYPPQVAVPVAVQVHNSFLHYYRQYNTLPKTAYEKVCADRDQARQERDDARRERDQAIQQRTRARQYTNQVLEERNQARQERGEILNNWNHAIQQRNQALQERDEAREDMDRVRQEVRQGVREEVRQEVREEVRQEVREEVRQGVREEVRQEVREEVRQGVREDVRQEVREEVREEVRQEVTEEVREEVREEISEEVRENIRQEVRQEVREEVREDMDRAIQKVRKEFRKDMDRAMQEVREEMDHAKREVREEALELIDHAMQEGKQKLEQKIKYGIQEVRQEVKQELTEEFDQVMQERDEAICQIHHLEQAMEDAQQQIALLKQQNESSKRGCFSRRCVGNRIGGSTWFYLFDMAFDQDRSIACPLKSLDEHDSNRQICSCPVTIRPMHVEVTPPTPAQQQQTQGDLTFERALQKAQQHGQLPLWQGPGCQQDFINQLIRNTPAKSEYNSLCKAQLGIQYANEKIGNQGRLQAIHQPQVAVLKAVRVYNSFLQYYNQHNNTLPLTSYQKACADRDQFQQERDQFRQERDDARRETTRARRQINRALQERNQAREEVDRVRQEAREEVDQVRQRIVQAIEERDHAMQEWEEIQENWDRAIEERDRAEADNTQLKQDALQRNAQLTQEKNRALQQNAQMTQEKDEAQQQIALLKREMDTAQQLNVQLTQQKGRALQQIAQVEEERDQVKRERDQALQQKARVEGKLERAKRELQRLRAAREFLNVQEDSNQIQSFEALSPGFRSPSRNPNSETSVVRRQPLPSQAPSDAQDAAETAIQESDCSATKEDVDHDQNPSYL